MRSQPSPTGWREFDLAIVTPPRPGTGDQLVFDELAAAGLAIVVVSAVPERIARSGLTDGEFVGKPFTDEELLAACRRAIAAPAAALGQGVGRHLGRDGVRAVVGFARNLQHIHAAACGRG